MKELFSGMNKTTIVLVGLAVALVLCCLAVLMYCSGRERSGIPVPVAVVVPAEQTESIAVTEDNYEFSVEDVIPLERRIDLPEETDDFLPETLLPEEGRMIVVSFDGRVSEQAVEDSAPVVLNDVEGQNPSPDMSDPSSKNKTEKESAVQTEDSAEKTDGISNTVSTNQPILEGDRPLLAIVIDDMGINQARTKDILSLKAPLTSSFLTYGKNLKGLAMQAHDAGHELMMHTPMEPKGPASLAPDTMKVDMSKEKIEELFKGMLLKFQDLPVRGINNHMGSRFTENKEKLGLVMSILKQKDLYFLDSKTTSSSVAGTLTREAGIPYVSRDVFLDNVNEAPAIRRQLALAEKIASKRGYAIAIGHPKSQTYAVLKEWLAEPQHVARLVPLSVIVTRLQTSD